MEHIGPIVGIEALGDWSFTQYLKTGKSQIGYKIFGYLCYVGVLEFFQKAIQSNGLSWANSAWDGWSNITTGLVALIAFHERPTARQLMGMILISVGLFFLGSESIAAYV